MAALEIYADTYRALGYDLAAAIAAYTAELELFATSEGDPAPAADALVDRIVRQHDGLFVIVPAPATPEQQPLPRDPRYYRSPAERRAILAKDAAEARK